ncbi:unnamed protein product [Arctogadus glacialis]
MRTHNIHQHTLPPPHTHTHTHTHTGLAPPPRKNQSSEQLSRVVKTESEIEDNRCTRSRRRKTNHGYSPNILTIKDDHKLMFLACAPCMLATDFSNLARSITVFTQC